MGLSQNLDEAKRVNGAVGQPMLGVDARIRTGENLIYYSKDARGSGELEVKTPGIFKEYWRLPDKTKEEFTGKITLK